METILVTGANGQLGQSLKAIADNYVKLNFVFKASNDLDITNNSQLKDFFENNSVDWCVNCAAYTAVDNAEIEKATAEKINNHAVEKLALLCKKHDIKLVHISTDFVHDGSRMKPYSEEGQTNPINTYGKTKLKGELAIKTIMQEYYIIRTSWLYSEYGSNFMKTMLRLSKDKKQLSIVNDQTGSPTYAGDLAEVICLLIINDKKDYGIYNYSNEGFVSWYDFAKEIFVLSKAEIDIIPVLSKDFKSKALRPSYSVLDKTKIKRYLNLKIPRWDESLKKAIKRYDY